MRPQSLTPQWYTSSSKTRPTPRRPCLLIVPLTLGAIFYETTTSASSACLQLFLDTCKCIVLLAWSTMMVLLIWPAWAFSYYGLGQGWCLRGFTRNTRVTRYHDYTWGGKMNLHCCNSYLESLDPDVTLYGNWQCSAQSVSLRHKGDMILGCVCGGGEVLFVWLWDYTQKQIVYFFDNDSTFHNLFHF